MPRHPFSTLRRELEFQTAISKDADSKYSNQGELTIGVEWINRKSPMIVWVGMVAVIHQYGVPLVQGVTIR